MYKTWIEVKTLAVVGGTDYGRVTGLIMYIHHAISLVCSPPLTAIVSKVTCTASDNSYVGGLKTRPLCHHELHGTTSHLSWCHILHDSPYQAQLLWLHLYTPQEHKVGELYTTAVVFCTLGRAHTELSKV